MVHVNPTGEALLRRHSHSGDIVIKIARRVLYPGR